MTALDQAKIDLQQTRLVAQAAQTPADREYAALIVRQCEARVAKLKQKAA